MAGEENGALGTIDLEAASDRIGASVFGPDTTPESGAEQISETPGLEQAKEPVASVTTPEQPVAIDPPKSWEKDMHPYWSKLDRKVQDYYIKREKQMLDGLEQYKQDAQYAKPFREVLTPYQQMLQSLNMPPQQAVDALFKAHMRLTTGTPESRRQAYLDLGKNLQINLEQMQAAQGQQPTVDPKLQELEQKFSAIEQQLTARQQMELQAAQATATKEVEAFASDAKAHPYFDEVATDIAAFVAQGKTLPDAYEMAVWANPVTRQKEIARVQTEHEAKLKETARLDALPKKRAAGVNIKSNGDGIASTGPVGSLEDTIREVHRDIKSRAS
jgi:hypothetical protein